jgi:hypothetical protein
MESSLVLSDTNNNNGYYEKPRSRPNIGVEISFSNTS